MFLLPHLTPVPLLRVVNLFSTWEKMPQQAHLVCEHFRPSFLRPPKAHQRQHPSEAPPRGRQRPPFSGDATRRRGRPGLTRQHSKVRLRQQMPRPSPPVFYKASSFSSRETSFSCLLPGSEVRASVLRAVGGRWRWSRALPRKKLRRNRRNRSIGRKYGVRKEVEVGPAGRRARHVCERRRYFPHRAVRRPRRLPRGSEHRTRSRFL